MKKTIKSRLTKYRFDISKKAEAIAYGELCKKLSADRECFNVFVDKTTEGKPCRQGSIEIETDHLFSNQFNTVCGHRVFAWFEEYMPRNKSIKRGHYIDLTEELKQLLASTRVCGYCGKQYPSGQGGDFCEACLDSEYLKDKDLNLLRLLPVALHMPTRAPLTEEEEPALLNKYIDRQTSGKDSRAVQKREKQRREIEAKCKKARRVAQEERDGLIWLLDKGLSVDNVIYYSHTAKFSFGWRSPLSWSLVKVALGWISEFPYPYEIKGIDEEGKAKTWEGY